MRTGRSKRTTSDPGGTSVESTRPAGLPVVPIVAALAIGGAIVIGFALHGRKSTASAAVTPGVSIAPAADASATAPAPPAAPAPAPQLNSVALPPPGPTAAPTINVNAIAEALGETLRHRRLWATVSVQGNNLEVRSALCSDPGVPAALNEVRASLRDGGLVQWRCVEDSGVLVFKRKL
jgi:hypothetical protein